MQEGGEESPIWIASDSEDYCTSDEDSSQLSLSWIRDEDLLGEASEPAQASDAVSEDHDILPPPKKRIKVTEVESKYRGKYWCFTENDPVAIVGLLECFGEQAGFYENIGYIMGQVEAGENGRAHFQGYVEMNSRMRLTQMKTKVSETAHFEKRRGTQREAIAYCRKEETRVEGPYEYGKCSVVIERQRSDLLAVKKLLDAGSTATAIAKGDDNFGTCIRHYKAFEWYMLGACLKNSPRDGSVPVKVILLFGEAGTGKTHYANTTYPHAYWKPSQSKWWNGYRGESTVIFDDFNSGWFTWDQFMRVTDRYSLKVETKGGYVDFCSMTMVFTTNTHPMFWYKNMAARYPALVRRIHEVLHFTEVKKEPVEVALSDLPLLGQPITDRFD